ncbi:MAG: dephospho-CoA kinase, partial [Mycobacteriaceae bacterium]|nr:dephospho-CoA kinase [Mycobacteriaceae bacterium]
DIPLLVENGLAPLFHLVIVVTADSETRVRRLVEHRGVTEADARSRIAAQATDDQRRAVADVLLDNSGAPGGLDDQVRALYRDRLVPFERNLREHKRVGAQYRLVPADPTWPDQARRLTARLKVVCAGRAVHIDHIGSTAVPGLDAKDVIDIQVMVPDLDTADALAEPLADAGFPPVAHVRADNPKPGTDPDAWAKRLHAGADPGRPATVHLRAEGSPAARFALVFRDWLRADPAARAEYLRLKQDAAAAAAGLTGHQAAVAYLKVKEPWFDSAYPRALAWSAGRD